jgi:DNA-directed RNA polymerase specialized sigma24 family protein
VEESAGAIAVLLGGICSSRRVEIGGSLIRLRSFKDMGSPSARKDKADLTKEALDRLLHWLDRDRSRAGQRYEQIRSGLIKVFLCRGSVDPEELADETINRVARKVQEIADGYVGDPALYFYGVAKMVYLEYSRRKPVAPHLPPPDAAEETDLRYECLEQCMQTLSAKNRKLILAYYEHESGAKIDHRKELADQMGITANALWIRVHRIKKDLQNCVKQCLRGDRRQ